MPDEFLTVDEIAKTVRVTPQSVRNWIDQGSPPAYRLGPAGRRVRVSRDDFERFLAQGQSARRATVTPPSAPEPPRTIWDGFIPEPQLPRVSRRGA